MALPKFLKYQANKFERIITMDGYLRLGMVNQHKDLLIMLIIIVKPTSQHISRITESLLKFRKCKAVCCRDFFDERSA